MYLDIAKNVFRVEADALHYVASKLDATFNTVVNSIAAARGKVIVCGIGKSGHVGKKIFATFISTGTPSIFLHPSEAFHGDLGMALSDDVFLAISNSGQTDEILRLIPFIKDNGNLLIAMTGNRTSTLAQMADFCLDVGVQAEACPLQLAPTASTTASLVMGDALAIALMKVRSFSSEQFARVHPGGTLGHKLLGRVCDFMSETACVSPDLSFKSVLTSMSQSVGGVACVVENGKILGLITDGDIRRKLATTDVLDVVGCCARDFMNPNPKKVPPTTRCTDADSLMSSLGINCLLVEGESGRIFVYHNLNRK